MRKMAKLFIFTIIITMVLTWSMGCLAETKEITLWSDQTEPWQQDVIEKMVDKFEEINPGVKVNIEYISFEDRHVKLTTALATGTEPEVALLSSQYATSLPARGVLATLDDVVEEMGGREAFFESSLSLSQYNGKYYSLPYSTLPVVMWYRKDIFAEHDVKPPETWDELYEAAKILDEKTPNDMYGIGLPYGRNEWTEEAFRIIALWPAGGKVLNNDEEVVFDSAETREALEFYSSLYEFTPPGSESWGYSDTMNSFVTGITPLALYYGRTLKNLDEYNPEILDDTGVIIPPKYKDQATTNPPQSIGVFKDSDYPELGKAFLKYFLEGEYYAELLWATPGHNLPVLKAQVDNWREHELLKKYPEIVDKLLEVNQPGVGYSPTKEPGIEEASQYWLPIRGSLVIPDTVQRVTLRNEDIDEVLDWAVEELQTVIEEYEVD